MEDDLDRLRVPLAAMMRWFHAAGIRAAVIGGVAASLLGKPRLTKDIDAVVQDTDAEATSRTSFRQPLLLTLIAFAGGFGSSRRYWNYRRSTTISNDCSDAGSVSSLKSMFSVHRLDRFSVSRSARSCRRPASALFRTNAS